MFRLRNRDIWGFVLIVALFGAVVSCGVQWIARRVHIDLSWGEP